MSFKEFNRLEEVLLLQITGTMTCDSPNEYLDKWDGNLAFYLPKLSKITLNAGYV